MSGRIESYEDFWPYYLGEHKTAGNRAFHILGSLLSLGLVMLAIILFDWRFLLVAIFSGYAFAWLGHAFIERNPPATFKYPLWSLLSDFRMLGLWLTGRLRSSISRYDIKNWR